MTDRIIRQNRTLSDAQIEELINHLRGSSRSLHDALMAHFDITEIRLTDGDCEALDAEIFLCEVCGWWCDAGELTTDQTCSDCADLEGELE